VGKVIVQIQNNELFVGSWNLATHFKIEHRSIRRLLKRYEKEFEQFGCIKNWNFEESEDFLDHESSDIHCNAVAMNTSRKRGGQIKECMLTYEQYVYLITLLPNTDHIRESKIKLTKEFFRMRKVLIKLAIQKENEDWQAKRAAGLIERRLETDAIKDFIEYATSQGSQSANKYYVAITKMENNSLLNVELLNQKFENMRDVVDGFDLSSLQMADKIVAQALREGMKNQMHYKDIYELARDRVEAFALVIGRTPLRLINAKIKPVTLTFSKDRAISANC
jgi:phage regulator Rha-like protein